MDLLYAKSFSKDMDKLGSAPALKKSLKIILLQLENAASLAEITGVRKIQGYESYYRIRIGDYRLGLKVVGECVEIIRLLHRKDIYRHFP